MPIQPKPPTARGPADWFTGDVFIDAIARGEEPSRVRVSAVRFTPAARTAWHAHAVGQTLYVTEGRGLMQSRGGPVEEIRFARCESAGLRPAAYLSSRPEHIKQVSPRERPPGWRSCAAAPPRSPGTPPG